jgi:uncharacterized protein YbbK (DUF523 family)
MTTQQHHPTRILVSSCLLGQPLRYDGRDNRLDHPLLQQWLDEDRVVPLCPEAAGGLPTPRPAAELRNGRARTRNGGDVTDAFIRGAETALDLCREQGIRIALLAARSPSCGNRLIYDGSFSGRLVPGTGITAACLQSAGIRVFNPDEIDEAAALLRQLDTGETP